MDIDNGMNRMGGHENLVARPYFKARIADGHFQAAFYHGNQFIAGMCEIQLFLSGRINEQVAGIAA